MIRRSHGALLAAQPLFVLDVPDFALAVEDAIDTLGGSGGGNGGDVAALIGVVQIEKGDMTRLICI